MQLEHGDDEPALAVLRRAAELGFDHIDTAEFYGAGRVNSRIRAAPHPYPGHLVLAGKVGATSDPGGQYGLRPAQKPAELRSELEANLRTPGAGLIGGIGLCRVDADQLRHALPAGVVCVQNAYSLVDRSSEPVLGLCREHNIAWVPYFPLGSGFPELEALTALEG